MIICCDRVNNVYIYQQRMKNTKTLQRNYRIFINLKFFFLDHQIT